MLLYLKNNFLLEMLVIRLLIYKEIFFRLKEVIRNMEDVETRLAD